MKKSHQTNFRVAAVLVAVIAFLMSAELPSDRVFEAKPTAITQPRSAHTQTMSVSDKMITAKITIDDDDDYPVEATQIEGGLIRIEIIGKAIYGFSPLISEPTSGTVMVKIFRISSIINSGVVVSESLNEVNTLIVEKTGDPYFATYADADASFKIEIIAVQIQSQSGGPTEQNYVGVIGGSCCITCRGRRFCACSVSTPCGGCCDGGCC